MFYRTKQAEVYLMCIYLIQQNILHFLIVIFIYFLHPHFFPSSTATNLVLKLNAFFLQSNEAHVFSTQMKHILNNSLFDAFNNKLILMFC